MAAPAPQEANAMDGIASKTTARSAAAALALGLLSVGLAACGSDSSSTTKSTATAVKEKQAGVYRDVQVTVVNGLKDAQWFTVCFREPASGCKDGNSITAQSSDGASRVEGGIDAYSESKHRIQPSIESVNPHEPARPWITLKGLGESAHNWRMYQGDTAEADINGGHFAIKREDDSSDYVRFTITVS
jgi:hypothetical protein